jgi:hypothetical protein
MTQSQIPHQVTLPPCAAGHPARHILDRRAAHAGGGHAIECACRTTTRHGDLDTAITEWFRINKRRRPRSPKALPSVDDTVILQFGLRLQGGCRA